MKPATVFCALALIAHAQALSGAQMRLELGDDGIDRLAVGQGQQDEIAVSRDLRDGGGFDTVRGETVERIGAEIIGEHRQAAAAREVAAHGFAHYAQADEADPRDRVAGGGLVGHFGLPSCCIGVFGGVDGEVKAGDSFSPVSGLQAGSFDIKW